ncbi:MAG: aspartyl protease family protein [Candidatus Thorarchaeota archaeon]
MNNKTSEIDPLIIANMQFQTGYFTDAEKSYKKVLDKDPKNFQALVQLGNLALYSNKFTEAKKWLLQANELEPKEPAPHALLAEMYYRLDNFQDAAKHLRNYGIEDMALRLESFKGSQPYLVESNEDIFKITLLQVDPLPVIEIKINGKEKVNFLIDTGAAETMIDVDYAKENNLEIFGEKIGTFAGGKKATTYQGKVGSLTLGNLTIKNMPVGILPIRPISQIFGGLRIDGIIGTVLFYHFITTLDYTKGELILRTNTNENLKEFYEENKKVKITEIPFWMAEDHFMVAWGRVNKGEKTLFFLDTGLAGGGFTGAKATLEQAKVVLDEANASEGIGGGGKVRVVPFEVEELTFGGAVEKNIKGLFTDNFPIEYKLGFRIGGIISHQFFKSYSLTFDFLNMKFLLIKKEN